MDVQTPRVPPVGKSAATPPSRLPPLRSLKQYPPQVLSAFESSLQATLKRLVFKTAQTPPTATPRPLFSVKHVEGIEDVPNVVASGDVVLCFTVFPESYTVTHLDNSFENRNVLGRELDNLGFAVFQRLVNQFTKAWKLIADAQKSPPPEISLASKPEPDTLGVSKGMIPAMPITLASGVTKKTYASLRWGVVDAGSVAGVAVDQIWPSHGVARTEDQTKKETMEALSAGAGAKEAFAPAAVAKYAQAKMRRADEVLAAIGRGLGYTAIHEFWHATRGEKNTGHVPEDSGLSMTRVIEGAANPSFRVDGLTLLDKSVNDITQEYEQTWCKFIQEGREKVTALTK